MNTRLLRCTLVWRVATAAAVLAAATLWSDAVALAAGPGADLATALVRVGALAALACVAWAWLAASAVVVEALRGGVSLGLPAPVRRALLGACGVALAGGLATGPATADPGLDGLPLPDRATGAATTPPAPRPPESSRVLVVRPGDSLWALAAAELGPHASPAAVDRGWRRLYLLNRPVIGPDPDLILPGQQLRPPTPLEEPS